MPSVAEGVLRHVGLPEVLLHDHRATNDNFTNFTNSYRGIVVIVNGNIRHQPCATCGAWLIVKLLNGHEAAGFGLTKARVERRAGLRLKTPNRVRHFQSSDVAQIR